MADGKSENTRRQRCSLPWLVGGGGGGGGYMVYHTNTGNREKMKTEGAEFPILAAQSNC